MATTTTAPLEPVKPPPPDTKTAFNHLIKGIDALKKRDPIHGADAGIRIAAHIRAVSEGKITSLGVYHASPNISDEQKFETYKLCFNAIIANKGKPDWSKLQGQVGIGSRQAVAPEKETAARVIKPPSLVTTTTNATMDRKVAPEVEAVKSEPQTTAADDADPLTKAIIRAVAPHLKAVQFDEDKVEAIADKCARTILTEFSIEFDNGFDDRLHKAMANGAFPEDRVKKIVDELTDKMVKRIEFVTAKGEVKPITGLLHPQATQLATWLRAGVPVWGWGAAGSGKTHMARQIAELLEITAQVMSVDPTLTVSKIMGYRNVANGGFIEGLAYGCYKNGGLLAMDEIDTGDPGVIASANALLSNDHYLFPNGETVNRHEKFYPLALANTRGMGAVAGYTARNKLDAATLDRFAIIEIKYDAGLESCLACGEGAPSQPWNPGAPASAKVQKQYVEWIQQVRAAVGDSILISPRASINGCKALRAGVPMKEVVEALVFKLTTEDSRKRITDKCGLPKEA